MLRLKKKKKRAEKDKDKAAAIDCLFNLDETRRAIMKSVEQKLNSVKKSQEQNTDPACSQPCQDVKIEASYEETSSCLVNATSVNQESEEFQDEATPESSLTEETMELDNCTPGSSVHNILKITCIKQEEQEEEERKEEEEEAKDDDYLYCEECRTFFIHKCEVHGPALFISDTPVPVGITNRDKQTLPSGLEIGESGIPGAGLGVFNKGETVPVGAHFGPYEGDLVDKEEAMNSGYTWVIYKSGEGEEYIDAKRETHANWMRYVNCSFDDKQHNLVAFQYRGGIHYRCRRPIQPGQELLVWYKEQHPKDRRITFDSLWDEKSSSNEMNTAASQGFSCKLCLFSFTSQIYLHKHIKRWHHEEYVRMLKAGEINYENLISPHYRASQKSQPNQTKPKQEIFNCSKCEKDFMSNSDLKTHLCVQPEPKRYHCLQCGKSFPYRGSLRSHKRLHTGEKPYQCSQCDKSFSIRSNLTRHQAIHSDEKTFYCLQCGQSFRYRSNLTRHQQSHNEDKTYQCSLCLKSFNEQVAFQDHQRSHAGEKRYQCSLCLKSFTRPSHLRTHQVIHTGEKLFSCSECGKSFSKRCNLTRHQAIHAGEKPYQCSECGKNFTRQAHLDQHQSLHTGEKPYQCTECGKGFTRQAHLQQHQSVHTR